MRISACSIVKNEEKNIARSIESYRRVVDEIIIVDTGSTDNTVAICEKLGAKVLHYEWNNDFAAAKNLALEHATGDWIIFLDADEWFVPTLVDDRLINVIKEAKRKSNDQIEALRVMLVNVEEKDLKVTSKTSIARIFKNNKSIRYVGSIHEEIRNEGRVLTSAKLDELEVYHSGYTHEKMEDKSKRNLALLYDKYNKGEAEDNIYFYLCRENAIAGKYEEGIKFYNLFINSSKVDKLIESTNVYVSIYEFGINLKKQLKDKYTSNEIKEDIENAIKKYPQIPMHYYLLGCYYFDFDHDQALFYLEKALEINKTYKEEYINNFIHCEADAYLRIAHIYKVRHDKLKALDAIVEAIKLEPLKERVFIMLMSLIRNQTPVDIILFLSRLYDLKSLEHVRFLTKQLMWSKCHEVFIYFAKKLNQEFGEEDESTYIAMLLTNQAVKVTQIGMAAYYNGGKDDDRYFATLGMILNKDQEAFEQYKRDLNRPYATIVQRFIEGIKISNPTQEEINAWIHLYGHMYYIASEKQLVEFESLFEKMPASIAVTILDKMLGYEDYERIKVIGEQLEKAFDHPTLKTTLKLVMSYQKYFNKDYAGALEAFKETCFDKESEVDSRTLHYLQAMGNCNSEVSIKVQAKKLFKEYLQLALREREINEALQTNKIEELDYEYSNIDKTIISLEEFKAILEDKQSQFKTSMIKNIFALMEKYIEINDDDRAFSVLVLLIQNDYMKDVAYFRLGELFNRSGNSTLALYCHEQAFVENPLFAKVLVGEKALQDGDYRYHHIETENRVICPICGGESKRAGVYNTLLSKDYSVDYPAVKIWRKCSTCSHLFTENVPFNIPNRNNEADSQQVSCKMINSNNSMDFIHQYQSQGAILEVNVEDPSFMLLAEEYGYNVKGLIEDDNKADKIQREYGLDIEHASLNTYNNEKQFDVISITNILEKSNNPVEIIKKAASMLSEEGVLYIKTPNYMSASSRSLGDNGLEYRKVKTIQYFSRQSMMVLLEENGFEMITYQKAYSPSGVMEIIAKKIK